MLVVSLLFAALVALGAVVTIEIARRCLVLAWRSPAVAPRAACETLVLRPVKGSDPWVEENLALRVVGPAALGTCREAISVEAHEDPAHLAALRVARAAPAVHVSAGALPLPNPKIAHLAYAMQALPRCDHTLVVDADVDPRTLDLASLLGALEAPEVEAAWQPVVEGRGETAGDLLSEAILLGSFHAFPLLGLLDDGGLVGKVSIVRTGALDAMGGLAAFGHVLGEDMALAAEVRARGRTTRMVAGVARSVARGRAVREVFERFVRWTLVTKSQRPRKLLSYPLFFFPLPIVLVAAAVLPLHHEGAIVLTALASRLALVVLGVARAGAWSRLVPMVFAAPAADVLLAAAWVRALGLRAVSWRGRAVALGAHGRLEASEP